jgi:hypothetical protein
MIVNHIHAIANNVQITALAQVAIVGKELVNVQQIHLHHGTVLMLVVQEKQLVLWDVVLGAVVYTH